MDAKRLTQWFFRLFIASIIVTAVVGIMAISVPTAGGWIEIKILLTTGTIAAASVLGLACGGCLSRGHRILPIAGLVLTALSAVLLLVGLWAEIDEEWYWKMTVPIAIFAVGCAHLSMLYMANLAGQYRWAYVVAYQLIMGLAALVSAGIIFEFFDSEGYVRFTGVISILVAAITLLVPVFHFMSRDQVAAERSAKDPVFAVDEEIARLKKQLIELENRRRVLLGREPADAVTNEPSAVWAGDGPAH